MAETVLTDPKVDAILKRFEKMVGDRGTLDGHCEEVAARVLPSYKGAFTGRGTARVEGEKKNELMFDSTAALSLTKFAAVMESMLTPRGSKWHRLVPPDKALLRNRQAREWYEETNDRLYDYRYAPRANFASQKQEDYLQLGAFGTGALFIDQLAGSPGLRYKSCSLADIYFQVNHQGMVDTAYRRVMFTARQAFQKWGPKVPADIKNCLDKEPDRIFEFVHCVEPREDMMYGRLDYKGMPWASYYVSKTGRAMMSEGGYHSWPYSISRHVVAPEEVYGRSPAMMVLPNIKVLNEQKRTVLKQGHRAVDPVLLAHDDGVLDTFSLKSGAINYGGVNADGRALVHALPVGNLAIAKEMMQDERAIIKDAFYVTLFEILVEDRRDMTATEVLERAREKGVLLAPAMGRQQTEALGPQIERELDLLAFQGLLPPMPPILQQMQAEYKAEYDSPLSRAMRAEEASGFFRWVDLSLRVAAESQNPAALDWIDFDTAQPEIADINAVPVRWVNTVEKVKAIREGRNQAQQTQQLIDAAPAAAGLVKAMQP
jgi:hypothetical protein